MEVKKILLVGLASLWATSVCAAELPKKTSYQSIHCFAGESAGIKHSDTHIVWSFHLRGTSRSKTFGLLSSQCVGSGSRVDNATRVVGFCQFTDGDGETFLGEFDRTGKNGKWTILSGTGKFSSMKGGGTYVLTGYPRLAPGKFQGCAEGEGTYTFAATMMDGMKTDKMKDGMKSTTMKGG